MRFRVAILTVIAFAVSLVGAHAAIYLDRDGSILPPEVTTPFLYNHITTDATTVVKSTPGILGNLCINTTANGETITIYDNTAASGTVVGIITLSATSIGCFQLNLWMATGITIVTGVAAGDLTVHYR